MKIDMRFKNGVLFVRLHGSLDFSTAMILDSNMTSLIMDNGIRYVLLNLKNLKYIDSYGMQVILDNYHNILKNDGKLIICGNNRLFNDIKLSSSLYQISSEDNVYEVVNI